MNCRVHSLVQHCRPLRRGRDVHRTPVPCTVHVLCASLTLACADKDEGDSAGGLSPGDFPGKCGAHREYILTTATGCETEMLDEYHSGCVGDCAEAGVRCFALRDEKPGLTVPAT